MYRKNSKVAPLFLREMVNEDTICKKAQKLNKAFEISNCELGKEV